MSKPENYAGIRPKTASTERAINVFIPAFALAGVVALGAEDVSHDNEITAPALTNTVAVMPEEVAVALPAPNKVPNPR